MLFFLMKLERTKDRIIFPIKVQPMEATFPNTITLLLSKKKQRSKNEHKHPSFSEAKNTKKESCMVLFKTMIESQTGWKPPLAGKILRYPSQQKTEMIRRWLRLKSAKSLKAISHSYKQQ